MAQDPFEALGVPRDASTAEIKSRYRVLAKRYHPNRHPQCSEPSPIATEHFYAVNQAWKLLSKPNSRRRYGELLQLLDEQQAITTRLADILNGDETKQREEQNPVQAKDGYVSSDADDDALPHVGLARRQTMLERTMTGSKHLDTSEIVESGSRMSALIQRRIRANDSAFHLPTLSTKEHETKANDYFTLRRKKLDKLKRKEGEAFFQYRDAMIAKFEAELEAERKKEHYEQAVWKRAYFERAPKETAERLRSFQHFMGAVRAFGQQSRGRWRNRSTLSGGQILSTDDIPDSAQYLRPDSLMSPSKKGHQRGWSSDISGDQTSSDDDSSESRHTHRPHASWVWHKQHSRHELMDAIQRTAHNLIHRHHDSPTRPGASSSLKTAASDSDRRPLPFQMIIKRPTGFGDNNDGLVQDSSASSYTGSSRSPSPVDPSLHKFTILQSSRVAEFLGNGSHHEVQPSVVSDASNFRPSSVETRLKAVQEHDFMMKHIGRPQFQRIPEQYVHMINYAEKSRMFGNEYETADSPPALLARLASLDQTVANKFMVKPDTKASFNFRLVYTQKEVLKRQHQSYIALSYRRKIHVEKSDGHFALPLEPEMFQAMLDERISDSEGVWIDQICIDQESDQEKTISMSAMDMVYRSARLAVVVLDDIELGSAEGQILENHMNEYAQMSHVPPLKRFRRKQPAYLDSHDDLYQVIGKILRSSWFRRAWCRHEMRLAKDHIFLVPCNAPGTWTGRSVVRFTSQCLAHLLALATEVPFVGFIEMVKPALHAFFRDRCHVKGGSTSLRSHHGNFTTVVAEVFAMEAGGDPRIPAKQRAADAMKDKISIILNTMECGLALNSGMRDPSMSLTKSECQYMLVMLALAARDPGSLCSVGPPMNFSGATESPLSPNAKSTWLFEPTNVDSGLNNYRTLNRLPEDAIVTTHVELGHYVQLDLKFPTPNKVTRPLESDETTRLARHFIQVCSEKKLGRNRSRYLISDPNSQRHFGNMSEVYVQTLACVFECGPDWMEQICHRYGVSRWKQDLQGAYELLIALKNTSGRWPADAWSAQSAGFVMDFVNFLIIRGLPQRQIIHYEEWRPIWVATDSGGKVLTFVPPGNIHTAVPSALLDPDYVHLARLWILEPKVSFYQHDGKIEHQDDWTLLGKSVLFSDDTAIDHLQGQGGEWRKQQRVFGREDPDIQRLLRERSLHF
ncbi:Hypothetical protein R9X50_00198100 [Acrodontium crateriforme]|uniref:J domain-containing protein n=1 Tax=Acrodontium crateriforme TaxID=150365 RepID=A0AAQ3M3D8_9PEZI|nr:Hypothetical protein R9X50_00198100 [Acrodontium crateriforme]